MRRGKGPANGKLPSDRHILDGLKRPDIGRVDMPGKDEVDTGLVQISELRVLGSYNWGKAEASTIIVPGSPPCWSNRALPYQVELDKGKLVFVDENTFRAPAGYALLPLIAAVDKTHELQGDGFDRFDWGKEKVDFITTRNVLRKLLRWVDCESSTPPGPDFLKGFRIDTQLAGNTVILNRWEKRDREEMQGYTYGLNFESAATTPATGITENTGHQRIISYDLNGLKMVVRFEVDAYLPDNMKPNQPKMLPTLAELDAKLSRIKLGSDSSASQQKPSQARGPTPPSSRASASPEPYSSYHGLMVIEGGIFVPQSNLVDLSTRSEARMAYLSWADFYMQHFLSQTDMHFIGIHERGLFSRVIKRAVLKESGASSEDGIVRAAQPSLQKLRAALQTILDLVRSHGQRGRITLTFKPGESKLLVFERESMANCLPEEVLERFA
uniref:Geranylgeranyl pyrophosphate synthetase n=1 Tax=Mycena chlorophos TaxID=658473 RepID=A0ABQ0KZZ5_MYCCL|nr:predicted protein [Mycena chlorophos]